MPKFIIEQDSSRKINNEPMPLGQFVPGAISLKNTNSVYTLFVGEINNGSLVDDLDVFKGNFKYYQQLLTLLPRLRNDVVIEKSPYFPIIKNNLLSKKISGVNKTTGNPKPYTFVNTDPINIPHPNKNTPKLIRKDIIASSPIARIPNINLGNILKPVVPNTVPLQNKVNELINKPVTKLKSSDIITAKVKPQVTNNNIQTPIQAPIQAKTNQQNTINNKTEKEIKPTIAARIPTLRNR